MILGSHRIFTYLHVTASHTIRSKHVESCRKYVMFVLRELGKSRHIHTIFANKIIFLL